METFITGKEKVAIIKSGRAVILTGYYVPIATRKLVFVLSPQRAVIIDTKDAYDKYRGALNGGA